MSQDIRIFGRSGPLPSDFHAERCFHSQGWKKWDPVWIIFGTNPMVILRDFPYKQCIVWVGFHIIDSDPWLLNRDFFLLLSSGVPFGLTWIEGVWSRKAAPTFFLPDAFCFCCSFFYCRAIVKGHAPPKTNRSPKQGLFQYEILFQPLIFREHVSFLESICLFAGYVLFVYWAP